MNECARLIFWAAVLVMTFGLLAGTLDLVVEFFQ
jgi:hypothetical protein